MKHIFMDQLKLTKLFICITYNFRLTRTDENRDCLPENVPFTHGFGTAYILFRYFISMRISIGMNIGLSIYVAYI